METLVERETILPRIFGTSHLSLRKDTQKEGISERSKDAGSRGDCAC